MVKFSFIFHSYKVIARNNYTITITLEGLSALAQAKKDGFRSCGGSCGGGGS